MSTPAISTSFNGKLTHITTGQGAIYFSYETPVAFRAVDGPLYVRENVWGPTTGKHLNSIDGGDASAKARRVGSEVFTIAITAAYN